MLINIVGVLMVSLLKLAAFICLAYFYHWNAASIMSATFVFLDPLLLIYFRSKHKKIRLERGTVTFEE